jgi:cobalamin-dependent methionine synthase I
MQEGDMIKGYVVDVLANAVVEEAMDRVQENLSQEMAAAGLNITNRYSPGYCGWDIAEQQKLFSLLPEGFVGISLTPSSLMQPMKSVSGIIGIGKAVRFNHYTCNLCDDTNCLYRNKR